MAEGPGRPPGAPGGDSKRGMLKPSRFYRGNCLYTPLPPTNPHLDIATVEAHRAANMCTLCIEDEVGLICNS